MVNVGRLFNFGVAAFAVISLASCGPKKASSSSISIILPSAQNQKISSKAIQSNPSALGAFDFTLACFAVNVVGDGIDPKINSCGPNVGIFSGFKTPGSTVQMIVPTGKNRSVEVYLFNRASAGDSCPLDFSGPSPDKFTLIGTVSAVDMTAPTTNVDITVAAPAAGVNLVTQLSLPGSCVASGTPPPTPTPSAMGISRVFASKLNFTTSSGYTANVRVSKQQDGEIHTGSGYTVILGPKSR